jgi:hypothetical protein
MNWTEIEVTLPLSALAFFFIKEVYFFQKNRNGTSPYAKMTRTLEKMTEQMQNQVSWNEKHCLYHEVDSERMKELGNTLRNHEDYEERILNEILRHTETAAQK